MKVTYLYIQNNINDFMETNVMKKSYQIQDLAPLSVKDRKKLAKAIIGHGNLKKAISALLLTEQTIKRAKAGERLRPETKAKLEKYIASC